MLLPDDRIAWLFSDTFLGTVNPDRSRPAGTPMINNSIVVERHESGVYRARWHGRITDLMRAGQRRGRTVLGRRRPRRGQLIWDPNRSNNGQWMSTPWLEGHTAFVSEHSSIHYNNGGGGTGSGDGEVDTTRRDGPWVRRVCVVVAAVVALTVATPLAVERPKGGSEFPLAALWDLI